MCASGSQNRLMPPILSGQALGRVFAARIHFRALAAAVPGIIVGESAIRTIKDWSCTHLLAIPRSRVQAEDYIHD